jgi:hypothetical protein
MGQMPAPAKWKGECKGLPMPVTPPPRELESPNLASELPHVVNRNELATGMHMMELP